MAQHRGGRMLGHMIGAAAAIALVAGAAAQPAGRGGGGVRAGAPGPGAAAPSIPSPGLAGVRSQAPRPLGVAGPAIRRDFAAASFRGGARAAPGTFVDPPTGFVRAPGGFVRRPTAAPAGAGLAVIRNRDRDRHYFLAPQGFRSAADLRNEDFWLRLHLGSPGDVIQHGRHWVYPKPHTYLGPGPFVNQWPYGRIANQWPVYTVPQTAWDPYYVVEPQWAYAPPDFEAFAPPPRELTPREHADLLTAVGRPSEAVEAYRRHLEGSPEDTVAMRSMAVALLKAGRPEQAVAVAAMAYERDPAGLAMRPISAADLFQSDRELRRTLNRAVTYANRVNTASSWLLVASLMQAEGRDHVAARMVDRAAEIGLSERVAGALMIELRS